MSTKNLVVFKSSRVLRQQSGDLKSTTICGTLTIRIASDYGTDTVVDTIRVTLIFILSTLMRTKIS